jgi:hypothetical protein
MALLSWTVYTLCLARLEYNLSPAVLENARLISSRERLLIYRTRLIP